MITEVFCIENERVTLEFAAVVFWANIRVRIGLRAKHFCSAGDEHLEVIERYHNCIDSGRDVRSLDQLPLLLELQRMVFRDIQSLYRLLDELCIEAKESVDMVTYGTGARTLPVDLELRHLVVPLFGGQVEPEASTRIFLTPVASDQEDRLILVIA